MFLVIIIVPVLFHGLFHPHLPDRQQHQPNET
jgi:hypothetical protein